MFFHESRFGLYLQTCNALFATVCLMKIMYFLLHKIKKQLPFYPVTPVINAVFMYSLSFLTTITHKVSIIFSLMQTLYFIISIYCCMHTPHPSKKIDSLAEDAIYAYTDFHVHINSIPSTLFQSILLGYELMWNHSRLTLCCVYAIFA